MPGGLIRLVSLQRVIEECGAIMGDEKSRHGCGKVGAWSFLSYRDCQLQLHFTHLFKLLLFGYLLVYFTVPGSFILNNLWMCLRNPPGVRVLEQSKL